MLVRRVGKSFWIYGSEEVSIKVVKRVGNSFRPVFRPVLDLRVGNLPTYVRPVSPSLYPNMMLDDIFFKWYLPQTILEEMAFTKSHIMHFHA